MNNTKPFYESRTYLSLIPLVAIFLKRVMDIDVSEMEIAQIFEAAGLLVSMIIVAYGRYHAKTELTLLPKKKNEENR